MSQGAIAAGNPLTVEAGLEALRAGGNAVDAAIAALLMAGVAEPMLTGLGGAGIATVRMGGEVLICDLFANMPGLGGAGATADIEEINIDFGPTSQRFRVGLGTVAVPGIVPGVLALHRRYARLPLQDLVEPAALAAERGVVVQPTLARILGMLWPICQRSPALEKIVGPSGCSAGPGELIYNPALAESLRRLGRGDERALEQEIIAATPLSADDFSSYTVHFQDPIRCRYRDAAVWIPSTPSIAGLLVLQVLAELEAHGPMPPAMGPDEVRLLTAAMVRAESSRGPRFNRAVFLPGFVEGFLTALRLDDQGKVSLDTTPPRSSQVGSTTHISVVDADGNAAGITSSLGESCGHLAGETGIIMNNFLGEADVNPPGAPRAPGERLMTMCCPTILERGEQVFVLGSSGSSRIRSAVLHGLINLTDHHMTPEQAVAAPRCHVEGELISVEADGRPRGTMEILAEVLGDLRRFDGVNMYFGGMNIAGVGPEGVSGAGDFRRSGCYAEV